MIHRHPLEMNDILRIILSHLYVKEVCSFSTVCHR
eukprot:UN14218